MNQPYLIKDVARLSGQSIYTLKFYLKLGLIREIGRSQEARFRYFDDSTVAQLSQIRAWRKAHKSLSEIHHLLSARESARLTAYGHSTSSFLGPSTGPPAGAGQPPASSDALR